MYNDSSDSALLIFFLILSVAVTVFAYFMFIAWRAWKKEHHPNLNLAHNESISFLREAQYNLQEAEDRLTLAQTQSWNKPTTAAIQDLQQIQETIKELVQTIYAVNEQHNMYLNANNLSSLEDWEHPSH